MTCHIGKRVLSVYIIIGICFSNTVTVNYSRRKAQGGETSFGSHFFPQSVRQQHYWCYFVHTQATQRFIFYAVLTHHGHCSYNNALSSPRVVSVRILHFIVQSIPIPTLFETFTETQGRIIRHVKAIKTCNATSRAHTG